MEYLDTVIQLAVFLLGGGFMAAILTYVRTRRKDTMEAYADLYDKIAARCDKCEQEVSQLREAHANAVLNLRADHARDMEIKNSEIRRLRERVSSLERGKAK